MDALAIADGFVVADLAAAGGWFTIRLAHRVGPNGMVYAEDIQQNMLDVIRRRVQRENVFNVKTVLGTASDPLLPHGIDAVLIVNAYHDVACSSGPSCADPIGFLRNVEKALKPQGRLGVVDFNAGAGGPGPSPDQRVDPQSIVKAAAEAGLQLIKREALPPFEFLLVFGKAAPKR